MVGAITHDSLGKLWFRFDVSGFPTLKFFPKGTTEAQDYEGPRTLEELLEFVNDKAGTYRTAEGALNAKVPPPGLWLKGVRAHPLPLCVGGQSSGA